MGTQLIFWLSFVAIYLIVFFIDMSVTNHRKGEISVNTALKWSALWVSIALLYGVAILFFFPQNEGSLVSTRSIVGLKFFSGYLTEYSLSIDNLFVFIMIFSLMGVVEKNQPKLLKLGILISIVLRILFIVVGMGLIEKFNFIIYIFGAILLWTAYKMAFTNEEDKVDPKNNFLYKWASKLFPVDTNPDASYFFKWKDGKIIITGMVLVLLVLGSTDVLFAIDSIPAIIGVIREGTKGVLTLGEEQFIAITSNTFAVMGLVSLFFALKGIMKLFRFLKQGVSFILFFIGAKMLLTFFKPIEEFFVNTPWISLTVIVATLVLSILVSILIGEKIEVEEEIVKTHVLEEKLAKTKQELEEELAKTKRELEELKLKEDLAKQKADLSKYRRQEEE